MRARQWDGFACPACGMVRGDRQVWHLLDTYTVRPGGTIKIDWECGRCGSLWQGTYRAISVDSITTPEPDAAAGGA